MALECSTVTPQWMEEVAETAGPWATASLDAPVVKTRPHAEKGIPTLVVGSDAGQLQVVRPVFQVLGGAIHHCGPRGAGAVMKLAMNAVFATQVAAIA